MLRDRWWAGRKTRAFTLQWHLTHACAFHCRHCYDRSHRDGMDLAAAKEVLAELLNFCQVERVEPRLCLTGGDPLLYPDFWELYAVAAQARISVSILGNPISAPDISRLMSLNPPVYYQVSLEGLRAHNDEIRGNGHFDQVVAFLRAAREAGLITHVMLTLTQANLRQVLPLAAELRGLSGRFSFNRLAQVGEGKDLETPTREEFFQFLLEYQRARRTNPILGFKDNLFNVLRWRQRRPLLPGCTGFGCGAAFNFFALLPDGEVHACRKFPSPIGHLRQTGLREIYYSEAARQYRLGSQACRACPLRNSCGGCLAVSHAHGLNPLVDRDPYCCRDTSMPGELDISIRQSIPHGGEIGLHK